jgi:hypothetical protein
MSVQECALYGDLVLWLRDRAAELLAEAGTDSTVEVERARLDELIRSWFFTPQDDLHGCAPRDLIWAEQMDKPNPVLADRLDEFFFDDCPICQETKAEVEAAELEGHEHGWQWFYDDGGYPLIAHYDPEGWDARWAEEEADFEAWQAEQEQQRETTPTPPYTPPPVDSIQVDPETFLEVLRRPWLDPELHKAAGKLAGCCDVPAPGDRFGSGYRRLTRPEATSLVAGLHQQGVDIQALLAQIDAWPYQKVVLDWLSDPEKNVAVICRAMETEIPPDAEAELARFRQHRDFIFTLARLIPPGARLWLQGWLEAVAHGVFAAAELPF